MQNTALPVVEAHQGEVVKFEADNCYAMFDDVLSAVQIPSNSTGLSMI